MYLQCSCFQLCIIEVEVRKTSRSTVQHLDTFAIRTDIHPLLARHIAQFTDYKMIVWSGNLFNSMCYIIIFIEASAHASHIHDSIRSYFQHIDSLYAFG